MTVTLIEVPLKPLKLNIPRVLTPAVPQRVEPQWYSLTPVVKAIELHLKSQYGIRYLWATALTSRLQIEEMLLKRNTTNA
jgi:hypothetical protein